MTPRWIAQASINLPCDSRATRGRTGSRSRPGWISPLCAASQYGHRDIVELLLQGDQASVATGTPETALRIACEEGHLDVVRLLVERNADVNRPRGELCGARKSPNFALATALEASNFDVARYLVEASEGVVKLDEWVDPTDPSLTRFMRSPRASDAPSAVARAFARSFSDRDAFVRTMTGYKLKPSAAELKRFRRRFDRAHADLAAKRARDRDYDRSKRAKTPARKKAVQAADAKFKAKAKRQKIETLSYSRVKPSRKRVPVLGGLIPSASALAKFSQGEASV